MRNMRNVGQALRKNLQRYKKIDGLRKKLWPDYLNIAENMEILTHPSKIS